MSSFEQQYGHTCAIHFVHISKTSLKNSWRFIGGAVFMGQEESSGTPLQKNKKKVNLHDIKDMTFSCTYRILKWSEGNPAQKGKQNKQKRGSAKWAIQRIP